MGLVLGGWLSQQVGRKSESVCQHNIKGVTKQNGEFMSFLMYQF